MSAFTSEVIEFPTAEEAAIIMANATAQGSSTVEHETLLDAIQVLSLGKITLPQVISAGIRKALQDGFTKGRTYDYFDEATAAYGEHISAVTQAIQPRDAVVQSMVHTGSYSKGRTSLKLVSELITPKTGAQYFEVERQDYYVSSGTVSAWKSTTKTIGLRTATELYVHDLSQGQFYFLDNGKRTQVYLGDAAAYSFALTRIEASGALEAYKATLNTISPELVRELSLEANSASSGRNSAQQKLFLTVFKTIKQDIVSILA
jgi:hypothetical protein